MVNILNHPRSRILSPGLRGALFYFGFFGAIGTFEPFLSVYFADLGLSGREIGILSAFFPLQTLVAAPWLSQFADRRRNHRNLLSLCLIGLALTLAVLRFPVGFLYLLPIIAIYSLFRSPIQPVADSLIVRMAVRHHLDYGRMRLWGSFSFAAFSLVCGYAWSLTGYTWMFAVSGLGFLLLILVVLILEPHHVTSKPLPLAGMEVLSNSAFRVIAIATFLVGGALGIGRTFEGVLITHLGGSEMLVGAFFAVSALSEIPSMHYGEWLLRYLSGPQALILSYSLMIASYLSYTFVDNPVWLLFFVISKGLGFGFFYVTTVALIDRIAPAEWKATMQSVVQAGGWGLGPLLAIPLGGILLDIFSPTAVFILNAVLVSLAVVVMMRLGSNSGEFTKLNF